jgi:hypothetical protein
LLAIKKLAREFTTTKNKALEITKETIAAGAGV